MRGWVLCSLLTSLGCGSAPEEAKAPAPAPPPAPAPAPEPEPEPEPELTLEVFSSLSADEQRDALMKLGEEVYTTGSGGIACLTCHQANGQGVPGAFPPLVGQKEHMGDCKKHAGIVIHGMSGELVVNGITYNGVMTPQGDLLDDLKIAAVLTYERNSWGNDYGLCLPDDVKSARTP